MSVGLVGSIPPPFASAIHSHWGDIITPVTASFSGSWDLGLIGTHTSDFVSTIHSQSFNGPHLVWLSDSPRHLSKLISAIGHGPDAALHQCRHNVVGGVTSSVSSFVTLGIRPFSILPSVPRSISSVIDHKLYPPQAHWLPRICPWKIILIPNFPSNPSEFLVIFHPQDMDDGPSLLLNSALPGIFLYGVSLLEFPIDSSLPGTICLPSSPCLLYLLVSCPPWCFDRVSYSG